MSLTGRFSDCAKYCQEGYLLWAEQVNATGGIGGRQVQVVIYDDESNPDTGRVLAERLIDRDGATAILGPTRARSPMRSTPRSSARRCR